MFREKTWKEKIVLTFQKIFVTLLLILLLINRPLYTLAIIFAFSIEHIFFVHFIILIYNHWNIYLSIKFWGHTTIGPRDTLYTIWIKRCKYEAYKRLYVVLLRQKLSLRQIVLTSIIIWLSIPIKILNLYMSYIKMEYSPREFIHNRYAISHFGINTLNIEILNGEIYLNGHGVKRLVTIAKNAGSEDNNIFNFCISLKNINEETFKNCKETVQLSTITALDTKKEPLYYRHPGIISDTNTIHITSNMPPHVSSVKKELDRDETNQWIGPYLLNLTKNHTDPSSIISKNVIIKETKNSNIFALKKKITWLMYINKEMFELPKNDMEAALEIEQKYEKAFSLLKIEPTKIDSFVRQEIINGSFDTALYFATHNDIIDEIKNFSKEKNINNVHE